MPYALADFFNRLFTGTPYGVLPTLQQEGKTFSGIMTISRYLAEKYGTQA